MKWFKHNTDASDDIRIIRLEEKFGNDGYATFFKCLEIVGKEGEKGRLSFRKFPKNLFQRKTNISPDKLDEILDFMARIHLCCQKSLKRDVLYFPKFRDRADNYSKYIKRDFEETSNFEGENKDKEENRKEKNKDRESVVSLILSYFDKKGVGKESLVKGDYSRNYPVAKKLLDRAGGDIDLAGRAIGWMSGQDYSWSLETVLKKFPEFLKVADKDKDMKEFERMYQEAGND